MVRKGPVSTCVASAILVLGLCAVWPTAAGAATPSRYTIPGKRVFPEGIAVVPGSRTFFVSSTRDGTIFRGDLRRPALRPFLAGGANGRDVAVGLKADRGGRLYVAGGPTGALFVYNSRNARLIRAFDTGLRAPASFVNDVAVAAGGDAYATDSLRPVIYRVPASSLTRASLDRSPPEVFLDLTGTPVSYGPGTNLNGIALTRGGGALLVVQSNTGALYRVDLASKRVSEVPVDGGRRLQGGDGLLLRGRDLYVVRNERERLVKVSLAPDLASGRVVETVRDRGFAYPTTLASAGERLLVVNSQLDRQPRGARAPALPFTVTGVRRP